jgi:hypothetical protein
MPAMTLRGRYLMREYWSDSDLFLRLTAEERELYVGLWMLADDGGVLPRDIPAIGAALFRYMDRGPREIRVRGGLDHLRDMGKVVSWRCCLSVPAVLTYPRAGRKNLEHAEEHSNHKRNQTHSNPIAKDIQRDLNPSPVPSLPVPTLPDVAGARAPEGAAPGGPWTEKIADLAAKRGMG